MNMNQEKEEKFIPIKVLLIEDDEDDYIIIRGLLAEIQTAVFDITWTSGYYDALKLVGRQEHDICLLDYRLGAYTGVELLEEKAFKETDIPIIFLTGQGEYSVDVKAMKAGVMDYLVKEGLTSSLLERAIRYALARARDICALKDAREELEEKVRQRTVDLTEANNELGKASEKIKLFAYSISHDLKSPATALFGLTRRLHDTYAMFLDDKGHSYCEMILKSAEQILSLVEKINIFISEKEMPLIIEELDLSEVLNEIWGEFSEQILERKINWSASEWLPSVRADRLSIIRVFRNLIENALKYGGDSLRSIDIGFEESGNNFIISVGDDGKGLNGNKNKDIFQPFERIEPSKRTAGSGMGLAIVKEIAEKHGGEVWAGQKRGKGAVFYFSIPKSL